MKIISNTINIIKLLLIIISIIKLGSNCIKIEPLKYNQIFVYPNTYEAPTMEVQLKDANFTAPFLSISLFEEDPRRKLRLHDFVTTIRYSMYKMTRGELEQIFVFADKNHDDLVDQKEWDAFSALFVFPFEACDSNGDYVLSDEEFKICWDADPKTKFVEFKKTYEEKKYMLIMDVVQTRGKNEINFSDYLFVRRSLFAWRECHSDSIYIAVSSFKCALRTAVPNKYHLKVDHERIYRAGLKLGNDPSLIELDYISYLRILYFTYVFSIFGLPQDLPWIEKVQFIKAIREDRFPTNFQEKEIENLYDLVNVNPFQKNTQMNFESFCFFFNIHRLFNKYSMEKPLQLNTKELSNLLNDPLAPYGITLSIDASKTSFTESQYLEVTMILQRLRLNERDFYYSFKSVGRNKQDASVKTALSNGDNAVNATYFDISPNITNRVIFFDTMCGIDKRFWTKDIFFRAFQWANLFTEMGTDKRWLVSISTFIEKLQNAFDTVNPPIGQLYRNNYNIYKSIPREIFMDILTFMALENYQFKFNLHKLSTNELINETLLKIILKDYGMVNMPDTVIDLAKKGFDSLRRRVYVPDEVIKYIITVHAAAGESVRNNEYLQIFNVKLNTDFSRKYHNFPRRYASSPLV
jgi:hypothetical protein